MKRNSYQNNLHLNENYLWEVYGHLLDDLQCYLSKDILDRTRKIIRNKDPKAYLEMSDSSDLQSINRSAVITDAITAFANHQIASLLKKYPFTIKGVDRKQNALRKFFETEDFLRTFDYKSLIYRESRKIDHLRTFIKRVLGPLPSALNCIVRESHFGPGVTLGVSDANTSSYFKYFEYPYTCTKSVQNLAFYLIDKDERWKDSLLSSFHSSSASKHNLSSRLEYSKLFEVVDGNKLTTVPKTAITDRTIAIEPLLNVSLQLGVDAYLKRRLKLIGVDLLDQSRNRSLAARTSSATIDLKNASDSISKKLVSILFPGDWREFLNYLRSPVGLIDGTPHFYEKISSMGNGFTFAIESLIFSAITSLSFPLKTRDDWAVYGDDIIVPSSFAPEVVENLKLFGFQINAEKTFLGGRVRESCGYDYFNHVNIRPIFLKKLPKTVKDLFLDHNRLLRTLNRSVGGDRFRCTDYILSKIPTSCRLYGPYSDSEFDTYIHTPVGKVYNHSLWEFKRLVSNSNEFHIKDFNFRKLMHDLKECSSDSGSRFSVTKRNCLKLKLIASWSGNWTSTYTHLDAFPSIAP